MRTEHEAVLGDSAAMDGLGDGSVELVVTSPPYPMIEMWDAAFARRDDAIGEALADEEGQRAFELMHDRLANTWREIDRVLAPGGIVCIDIGDAVRSIGDAFRLYPNHARVVDWFDEAGYRVLPGVLWRKPTNRLTKFMGSGTLPPNAYVTLEHEHLLTFRKGEPRSFEPHADRRYRAAYFWEERNEWFSDVWDDITGTRQDLDTDGAARERAGAFPIEIPYRLICMYSIYGDTVLDPFWGTGTTTVAAMVAARNSVGYETDADLINGFDERTDDVAQLSRAIGGRRLDRHREFVRQRREAGDPPSHEAVMYDFPVVTRAERRIQLYRVDAIEGDGGRYAVSHEPLEEPAR